MSNLDEMLDFNEVIDRIEAMDFGIDPAEELFAEDEINHVIHEEKNKRGSRSSLVTKARTTGYRRNESIQLDFDNYGEIYDR